MQIQLDFRSQDIKNCPSSPFLIASICNMPVCPQTACIHCTLKLWISVQLISCRLSQTLGCETCLKLKRICFVSICSHIKQNWNVTLLWKIYSNSIYQGNVISKYHSTTFTQMDFFCFTDMFKIEHSFGKWNFWTCLVSRNDASSQKVIIYFCYSAMDFPYNRRHNRMVFSAVPSEKTNLFAEFTMTI